MLTAQAAKEITNKPRNYNDEWIVRRLSDINDKILLNANNGLNFVMYGSCLLEFEEHAEDKAEVLRILKEEMGYSITEGVETPTVYKITW